MGGRSKVGVRATEGVGRTPREVIETSRTPLVVGLVSKNRNRPWKTPSARPRLETCGILAHTSVKDVDKITPSYLGTWGTAPMVGTTSSLPGRRYAGW